MKKKVLGLLMAAVLCLCLLPAAAGAANATVHPDIVDDNGNIKTGTDSSFSRGGPVLTESDMTLDGTKFYIVQGDITIDGDLTIDGTGGGLVICKEKKLTVNGALIFNGGSNFGIYGASNNGSGAGKLIIENSNSNSAAIRSTTQYTPQLNIFSGRLEIHGGNSKQLVSGVKLNSENKIHEGILDGEVVSPEEWGKSSIEGAELVIEYCGHAEENPGYVDYVQVDKTQHSWKCKACGFQGAAVNCCDVNKGTLAGIEPNGNGTHTLKCICNREMIADCSYEALDTPEVTSDGKGHTSEMCAVCLFPKGEAGAHTYDENGKCTVCTFEPFAKDETGKLYGKTKNDSGISRYINAALAEDHTITLWRPEVVTDKTIQGIHIEFDAADKSATLDMNGYALEYSGGVPLTVSNGKLTVTNSAEEGAAAITITQTGASQEMTKPAIRVTGGELIFKGNLTATGGGNSSAAAPAIEASGGTVTFEKDVIAMAQSITTVQTSGYTLSPAVKVTGGTVIFKQKLTATGGIYNDGSNATNKEFAVSAEAGTLNFQGDLDLNGGLKLTGSAQLANPLTQGTFTAITGSRISVEGANPRLYITDLLADGYAFAEKGTENVKGGGSYTTWSICNLTIVEHKHKWELDTNFPTIQHCCVCGASELHKEWTSTGECGVCHEYQCPHEEVDNNGECSTCHAQMVAKIEVGGNTTYTTDLSDALNKAADGTTITLLADAPLLSHVYIYDKAGNGKDVTLNLNNHSITTSNGGEFALGEGVYDWTNPSGQEKGPGKLTISGSGNVGTKIAIMAQGALDLSSWTGTMSSVKWTVGSGFTNPTGSATINRFTIEGWYDGAADTISLNGGTYGEIENSNSSQQSFTFGNLLADGYAFQTPSGFAKYTDQIAAMGIVGEGYTVVLCPHSGISVDDATGEAECSACGETYTFIATVDGKGYTAQDGMDKAIADWLDFTDNEDADGVLKLYRNYTADADKAVWSGGNRSNNNTIDLNGHKMSVAGGGAFIPANTMALTVTDSKGGGSISNIRLVEKAVKDGAPLNSYWNLTLESGRIDNLTIDYCNYGSSFNLNGGSIGNLDVTNYKACIYLKGGSLGKYTLPGNTVLADIMGGNNYYAEGTLLWNNTDTAADHSLNGFTIKQAPEGLDFALGTKVASVPLGGEIPFAVTPNDSGLAGVYKVTWFRRTSDSVIPIVQDTVTGVNASETPLDVFCVITGWSNASNEATVTWQMSFKNYKLTVEPANLSAATVTLDHDSFVFDNTRHQPEVVSVTLNGTTLEKGRDYTVSTTSQIDAGENYTLTITGMGNYTGSVEKTWTIAKRIISVTNVTLNNKAYDGKVEDDPNNVTGVTFDNLPSGVNFTNNKNFTIASVTYDSPNANAENSATVRVKLEGLAAVNYAFDADGQSYMEFQKKGVTIQKADAPTVDPIELSVANGVAKTYTIPLPALPEPTAPCKYGKTAYGTLNVAMSSTLSYYTGGATVQNGVLSLPIQAVETAAEGKIGDVAVTVTTDNYEDIILTINLNAVNKILPTGAPTLSSDKLTYGEELSKITLSGAMKDGETTVPGTFAWVQPDTKPNAGAYQAAWKFTPTDEATYAEATGKITITVNKAKPTGEPKYTNITAAGKTLADANLTTEGGTFKIPGTVKWELAETIEVKANTAYKWVFTPTDSNNYNTLEGSITLYSVSTGGGGGGSTTTNTETTTNPDGSVTKTETKSDGTVIETTTGKDGSVSKTESKTTTKSDGSTVETVTETNTGADGSKSTSKTETTTNKDGSKTETKSETKTSADGTKSETKSEMKTDANGVTNGKETTKTTAPNGSTGTTTTTTENGNSKTEAEARVSEKAVEDAKKSGEAVKVPTEVKAGEDSNSAPTVKVELPKNAGETKIEIPVSDANSGTVAVIVHPDGTEEIVKDSKPTEDGVQLTVDGSATVKIIDNSKDFIDTRNHWSRDEVNFVASREIFNGVGGNRFGVNLPMTRGMVNTVLARLAGIDTTPSAGQKWYEVGTEWAKQNGITDGTNPEASVTREQLATLLYRFYGSPAVSGTLSFADAGAVSDYAQDALLWATQNGILNGVGSNRVAPSADAQRAQVAAMMARYLKNVG